MGQRVLLFVFRTSAVVLVLAGLFLLGVWKLGGVVTDPAEDIWARAILEFLFRTGVTSLAAGILAAVLLWAIRPASSAAVKGEGRTSMGLGGMTSMMPPFLALVALLVMASSGPLLTLWKEGLALLEDLEAWTGGGAISSLFTSVLVLFLPVVGAATHPLVPFRNRHDLRVSGNGETVRQGLCRLDGHSGDRGSHARSVGCPARGRGRALARGAGGARGRRAGWRSSTPTSSTT